MVGNKLNGALESITNLGFRGKSRIVQFFTRKTSSFERKIVVAAQFQCCGVEASQPESWRFEPTEFEINGIKLGILETTAEFWQRARQKNLNQPL
jgi:hypothetical protein